MPAALCCGHASCGLGHRRAARAQFGTRADKWDHFGDRPVLPRRSLQSRQPLLPSVRAQSLS
eukprot:3129571-Alexandrium_andersonii.AAC.1